MSMRLATAEWADPALVEQKYPYRDGTVWLGRSAGPNQIPLGYSDDRHVCLVSGTRGGKGSTFIINNLCLWPGSILVVDPKGENATITAARRGTGSDVCEGLGQAVHVLDPFTTAEVREICRSRFNPLDALSVDDKECVDRAALIADALVVVREDAKDPFWDEAARSMVKALVLHILSDPSYEGRRNLVTLRRLIAEGDCETVARLRDMGQEDIIPAQGLLWAAVSENRAFSGVVAGIGSDFIQLFNNDPKVFYEVLINAKLNTEFIDSPGMQECLEASDFELGDLKNSKEGVSVFLCLPQRYMETHYRWLRMMIGLATNEMERLKKQPASGYPVLMLLDEFAGLKRMPRVEAAVAQMAGYGVKMFFVLQTLQQLQAVYKGNWETFLGNSGLKLFSSLDDHFSREYVSKLIGDTEIFRDVHSEGDSASESESASESTSQSHSRSVGESLSQGRSVSEGTSHSVSQSESHGTNRSTGTSAGTSSGGSDSISWSPNSYFSASRSSSFSQNSSSSTSEGTSEGWSNSETEGTSRGLSESFTTGRSHTSGTSESETSGTTHGKTHGRTSGTSETVHRRPLISPDEIGRMFARVDDRDRAAYPGLGLALIAGQDPVAFRRVNYYEDLQFIGYFQPHPDHKFSPPQKHIVKSEGLEKYKSYFPLTLSWTPAANRGAVVHAGDVIGYPRMIADHHEAPIRSPRAGRLVRVPVRSLHSLLAYMMPGKSLTSGLFGIGAGVFVGDFEILYYENGVPPLDPFADLAAYCFKKDLAKAKEAKEAADRKARDERAARQAEEREKAERRRQIRERRRNWLRLSGVLGLLLLVDVGITAAIPGIAGVLFAVVLLGLLAISGWQVWQTVEAERANETPPKTAPLPDNLFYFESLSSQQHLDAIRKSLPKAK